MKKHTITILCLLFALPMLVAQETISLLNPSFEDGPRTGKTPRGWQDCGFLGETPPDIQPGEFGVSKEAYDGDTYLGMVVRDNDTWERIGQKLKKPFQADSYYQFSIFICRSEIYLSLSQVTGKMVNYNTPSKLIIWGGDSHCAKKEKLAESDAITSFEWEQHEFQFAPTENHTYILLETFYEQPALFPYNGNVLLDNASDIIPISGDSVVIKPSVIADNSDLIEQISEGIVYYSSDLSLEEKATILQDIHTYLETDPELTAQIYIQENSRKKAKASKRLVEEELTKLGWMPEDYLIEIKID